MAEEKKKYTYTPYTPTATWTNPTFTTSGSTNALLDQKTAAEKNYTDFVGAGYTYANQEKLNDWMSKYEGRNPFSYDFNTDAMYQQYKDKYIKQGKMAMQDTMGQAAAMTGGYGSSYASTAGNQAYQASLENLNDIIPQLYQMAYDRYNQEGQDMLNNISLLQGERAFDYGVWGDKANMLAGDRSYYGTEYNNSWNRDWSVFDDTRTFDRGVWEYNDTRDYNEHTNTENINYSEFLRAEEERQAEEARQAAVPTGNYVVKSDGSTARLDDPDDTDGDGYTADESHFDSNGIYMKATKGDEDGTWYIGGKTVKREEGANPYTGTVNSDTKYGTFSNGYQPNNVASKYGGDAKKGKLSKSGIKDYMNGVYQNVWKTPDGKLWIWDGSHNTYLAYQE